MCLKMQFTYFVILSIAFLTVTVNSATKYGASYLTERKPEKTSDVNRDIEEILNLLPKEHIQGIFKTYVREDPEVASNWKYAHSERFQNLLKKIESSNEYNNVITELKSCNLNTNYVLEQLEQLFIWNSKSLQSPKNGNGLHGMLLNEIRPLFPMPKIKILSAHKYVFSSQFRKLIKMITSLDFKTKIGKLVHSKPVINIENDAAQNGIDVDAIYEFVASFKILYTYLMDVGHK